MSAVRRHLESRIRWLNFELREALDALDEVDALEREKGVPTIEEILSRGRNNMSPPALWGQDELEFAFSLRSKADRYRKPARPDFGSTT